MAEIKRYPDLEMGRLRRVGGSVTLGAAETQTEKLVGLKKVWFVLCSGFSTEGTVAAEPLVDGGSTVVFKSTYAGATMAYLAFGIGR